jgi:hypothetical protein
MKNVSYTYKSGCFILIVVDFLTIISFTAPYWIQSNSEIGFKNIGIWEICFENYKNAQVTNKKWFQGCKYILSPEILRSRTFFLPNWLNIVQILSIFSFLLTFLILLLNLISFFFNRLNSMFIFMIFITILTVILSKIYIFRNFNNFLICNFFHFKVL